MINKNGNSVSVDRAMRQEKLAKADPRREFLGRKKNGLRREFRVVLTKEEGEGGGAGGRETCQKLSKDSPKPERIQSSRLGVT